MIRRSIGGLLLVAILLPSAAEAARLYIEPVSPSLQMGDSEILSVRIDVDEATGECVNLVDATLHFPEGVDPVDTSVGRSILRLWVEEPTIDADARTVSFAGGIPNGYCGRIAGDPELTNVVAEVVVRSQSEVSATTTQDISFSDDTAAYLNDGQGTLAPLETFGAEVTLRPGVGDTIIDPWSERVRADRRPPEPFSISLERSESIFDGNYYIVFNTTDKQTGIAGYEVMEEPLSDQSLFRFGEVGAPWVSARSPYELEDQTLNSTIRVRAIDKAGNEYVATYVPDPSLRERQFGLYDALALTGLLTIVLFGVAVILYAVRRRRDQPATEDEAVEPAVDPDDDSWDGKYETDDHDHEHNHDHEYER